MIRTATTSLAAIALAAAALAASAAPAAAEFGIQPGSFTAGSFHDDGTGVHAILGEGASPDARAAAHPFLAATAFSFNTFVPPGGGTYPDGAVKDVVVELPPGFLGNPTATPRCQQAVLNQTGSCPLDTVVGVANVSLALGTSPNVGGSTVPTFRFYLPVYNMQPGFGEPALLGSYVANPSLPILIHLRLDPRRDYAITATVANISNLATAYASSLAIWGVPADSSHDPWRGTTGGPESEYNGGGCLRNRTPSGENDTGPESQGKCPSDAQPPRPFLINPAACDGKPVLTTVHVDSWQQQGSLDTEGGPDLNDPAWKSAVAESPPVEGCAALRFGGADAPVSLGLRPASRAADTPSAYEAKLTLPYNDSPNERANPTLRDTTVTLPEGVVVNPSSANGLDACTSGQIGLITPVGSAPIRFDGRPVDCPNASKIGMVEVRTPLIEHTLSGAVYLAKQYDNPFDSLLAIYIVIEDPETGTIVKLAGEVRADPQTGRLTTTFSDSPQLPFTELDLHFFGGPGASLVNPQTCGTKTTSSVLTPWSAPDAPAVTSTDSFQVEGGANGGPCPASEAQAPNTPSFEAGTTFTNAGSYSPFVLKLSRQDGSQHLKGLNVSLPPGLTGNLAGVPYCPEAAIAQAQSRSHPGEGALEQVSPSCPAASQVGTVTVGAGAGPQPYYAQGRAYLAGPYKGAPLSMVIVTPAVAGPFDLGTVTVRTGLYVDSETAQVSAKSDPLPTILEGIPLDVRSIALSLDRSDFTLNPTSCEAMSIGAEAVSVTGQVAQLHNRFQVGGCKGLDFAPKLALRVFGKTNRNAKPRFRAVLQAKPGEANIARAQVNLPHSEFLEQAHIKTICTRVQFAAGAGNGAECPKGSIYGHARAFTPLLDKPLEGPVFLRSSSHNLPDLVAALNGQINVALSGKVDSGPNKGIRNTFEVVPDAPVSKFILEMQGGKKGLLVNSENLCSKKAKTRAIVRFTGQNGKVESLKPRVANQCKKHHVKSHAK